MLLTDDNLIHSHRNHVHKGTLTLNSLIQLANVYCLTHKIFLYYVFTFLYITLFLVFFTLRKISHDQYARFTFEVK